MDRSRLATLTVSGALGAAAAVVLYAAIAPSAATTPTSATPKTVAVIPATPTVFAPCVEPAVLQGDTCVTNTTRIVTVPAPAPARQASTSRAMSVKTNAPVPASTPDPSVREDHDDHHGGEDHED